jgi:hypothetical protein
MIPSNPAPSPALFLTTVAAFALLTAGWLADQLRFFSARRQVGPDRLPRKLLWGGTAVLGAAVGLFLHGAPGVGLSGGNGRGFLWVWCAGAFLVLSLWRPRLHRRARPLFSLVWLAGLFLLGTVGLRTLSI